MASAASCRLEGFASHSVSFVRSFVRSSSYHQFRSVVIKGYKIVCDKLLFVFLFCVFSVSTEKNAAASEFLKRR